MILNLIAAMPLYVCVFLSVELVLSLFRKYDPSRACLLIWALVASTLYGMHYVYFHHVEAWLPLTDSIYSACNLSVYPMYLIYIYELTSDGPRRRRVGWMVALLAAAALVGTVVQVLYWQMSPAELHEFIEGYLYGKFHVSDAGVVGLQAAVHDIYHSLFIVTVVATVVVGFSRIHRYNQLVDSLYADPEGKSLRGISVILILMVVIGMSSVIVNILGRHSFVSSDWLALPSVTFSCLLFAIGHEGLWLQFSIRNIEDDEAKTVIAHESYESLESYESHGIQEGGAETTELPALTVKLRYLVEEERMFTQPDLRLDDLARKLGTNRTYLLRAMRQDLQMTFSEYINRQRILYAQALMKAHPDWSKADIATQVGYASLSSFYRNLREWQ